ncbi:DUF1206 domain-containing protein [Kineococcus glutinatus]|uniref:DUF1206 domain-containing protein n=1 Tax=Kineococcus glutinatus TaxID=1070872 RepID=A0ABP9HTX8_9ACTN
MASSGGHGSDAGAAARGAGRQVTAGAQRHAGTARRIGRWGVAAEGVVYLLVAWLALQIALGSGGGSADSSGALATVAGSALGPLLLVLLCAGFAAMLVWQVLEAVLAPEAKDKVHAVAKAVVALALGSTCVRLLQGRGASAGQRQQGLTQRLLEAPGGPVLVVVVGLAVVAYAVVSVHRGLKHRFEEKVEGSLSPALRTVGTVGHVARGVAFAVLGVLVCWAATGDTAKSRGLDAAFREIAAQPFGAVLLVLVALGVAAFGVFQIATAPRRRAA